jgi:hypothetical protein
MKTRLSVSTLGLLLVSSLAAGCAVTRGVVDVRPPVSAAPATGPMVSLDTVEDHRHFEIAPRDPSIPSLKDDRITDTALTSRAIARKRNGYGMAMGDVLLPEGRTVTDLAREALTTALYHRGYQVVIAPGSTSPSVAGLNVEILEFWAWFSPGFWAAHLECRIHLRVTDTMVPSEGSREFHGYVRLATQAATGSAWKNTVDKAIASLIKDIEDQLAAKPLAIAAGPIARPPAQPVAAATSPPAVAPASTAPAPAPPATRPPAPPPSSSQAKEPPSAAAAPAISVPARPVTEQPAPAQEGNDAYNARVWKEQMKEAP